MGVDDEGIDLWEGLWVRVAAVQPLCLFLFEKNLLTMQQPDLNRMAAFLMNVSQFIKLANLGDVQFFIGGNAGVEHIFELTDRPILRKIPDISQHHRIRPPKEGIAAQLGLGEVDEKPGEAQSENDLPEQTVIAAMLRDDRCVGDHHYLLHPSILILNLVPIPKIVQSQALVDLLILILPEQTVARDIVLEGHC